MFCFGDSSQPDVTLKMTAIKPESIEWSTENGRLVNGPKWKLKEE